jgi:CRP-like cAMP-binding protein
MLPPASCEQLLARAVRVPLEFPKVLVAYGEPVEHAYFPLSGVLSLLVVLQGGDGTEAASIGFEGMIGTSVVLGGDTSPHEVIVQVSGEAWRVPAGALRELLRRDEALRAVLLRYAQVLIVQTSRNTACNTRHEMEERLARWLLHIHDWIREDHLSLTQEFIASILGARRATVTIAAGVLARAGLIAYRRGEITILDRQGLEEVACEDYAVVREALEQLLPLPT